MTKNSSNKSRAFYLTVCSGKGGVGKTTTALLLARAFADSGARTLLVDADCGVGDVATLCNITLTCGIEQLLSGVVAPEEATVQIAANLSVLGALPGDYVEPSAVLRGVTERCTVLDGSFDIVVCDTASNLTPLTLAFISGSDLALTVTTPRIPSIADSYIQLKQALQMGRSTSHAFLVNQALSDAEGEHAGVKFTELADRFLGLSLRSLGIVPYDPQIVTMGDNQSLLIERSQQSPVVRKMNRIVKTLIDQHIAVPRKQTSLWRYLESSIALKTKAVFDDRAETVHS